MRCAPIHPTRPPASVGRARPGLLLAAGLWAVGCGLDWTVGPAEDQDVDGTVGSTSGAHEPEPEGGASSNAPESGGAGGAPGQGSASSSSSSMASSGSGSVECDAKSVSCDGCLDCTSTRGCQGAVDACYADDACAGLENCLYLCEPDDGNCAADCYRYWDAGYDLYDQALQCIYCACAVSCDTDLAYWRC